MNQTVKLNCDTCGAPTKETSYREPGWSSAETTRRVCSRDTLHQVELPPVTFRELVAAFNRVTGLQRGSQGQEEAMKQFAKLVSRVDATVYRQFQDLCKPQLSPAEQIAKIVQGKSFI